MVFSKACPAITGGAGRRLLWLRIQMGVAGHSLQGKAAASKAAAFWEYKGMRFAEVILSGSAAWHVFRCSQTGGEAVPTPFSQYG